MTRPASHCQSRARAWIQALRLPFYPLSWMGYTLGASLAAPLAELWRTPAYWLGYLVVFMIEALTVFVNDLHDFESDRRNANHGPFTGGGRVLVEGLLTAGDLRYGCKAAALSAAILGVLLAVSTPGLPVTHLSWLGIAAVSLGVGYTMPPAKLSHRGLGEATVALVHGLIVVQCGTLVMGGAMAEPAVLHSGLPLCLAIFPSITMAGLPDMEADRLAGKRTLAVKFGPRIAVILAGISAFAALALAGLWAHVWPVWMLTGAFLHACLFTAWSWREALVSGRGRIDGVLAASLGYVLWFIFVPLSRA